MFGFSRHDGLPTAVFRLKGSQWLAGICGDLRGGGGTGAGAGSLSSKPGDGVSNVLRLLDRMAERGAAPEGAVRREKYDVETARYGQILSPAGVFEGERTPGLHHVPRGLLRRCAVVRTGVGRGLVKVRQKPGG